MKLFFLAAISGLAVAASAASFEQAVTIRGTEAEAVKEYAPPEPTKDTDVKALWDELAAEAALMKVQIAEGRTNGQCRSSCNKSNSVNRARCRRNCDQIADKGGDSDRRTFSCDDCRTMPRDGRRRERCMTACREDQVDHVERCLDANTCGDCRVDCGTGKALDMCLKDYNCPGSDRRSNRSCSSAITCGECNSFCDIDTREWRNCRDGCSGSYSGSSSRRGRNRRGSSSRSGNCGDAETRQECKDWCSTNSNNKDRREDCYDRVDSRTTSRSGNRKRNGRGRGRSGSCGSAKNCKECNQRCSGDDRDDCRDDYCSAEELAEEKVDGVLVQKK